MTCHGMVHAIACCGNYRGMPSNMPCHAMAYAIAWHCVFHGIPWHMPWHFPCHSWSSAMSFHGICHGMPWHMPLPAMAYSMPFHGNCHGILWHLPCYSMAYAMAWFGILRQAPSLLRFGALRADGSSKAEQAGSGRSPTESQQSANSAGPTFQVSSQASWVAVDLRLRAVSWRPVAAGNGRRRW